MSAGFFTDLSHTVPPGLCARYGHQATVAGSRMIVVGGHDGARYLDDIWECDLNGLFWYQVGVSNATSRALPPPGPVALPVRRAEPADARTPPASAAAAAEAHAQRPKAGRLGRAHSAAATKLQAHARARRDRVLAAYRRHEANEQYDAAVFLQAAWRGKHG